MFPQEQEASRRVVNPSALGVSVGPFPQALDCGALVFISGQVSMDAQGAVVFVGDIKGQTIAVLDRIELILGECGLSLGNLVSSTVFLKDASLFPGLNEVWKERFSAGGPTRATVVTDFVHGDFLIEVQAIAAR